MKTLVLDRFEGGYAVCETREGSIFTLLRTELPTEASEGSVLLLLDDGTFLLDKAETESRRKQMAEKQKSIFEGSE